MTVYVAWTPELPEANLPGPWSELRVAAPGVLLVESDDTLSRVFHELKWALAEEAPTLRRAGGGDTQAARPRTRHPELAARPDPTPVRSGRPRSRAPRQSGKVSHRLWKQGLSCVPAAIGSLGRYGQVAQLVRASA